MKATAQDRARLEQELGRLVEQLKAMGANRPASGRRLCQKDEARET